MLYASIVSPMVYSMVYHYYQDWKHNGLRCKSNPIQSDLIGTRIAYMMHNSKTTQ